MGSFDVTCNISQLPITPGTPVRVLFLGRSPYSMDPRNATAIGEGGNSTEGCYSTTFWYPRMVPLKAEYSDYGQVRNVEAGLNLMIFWKQLYKDLWKVEQGPNPYHDPPSTDDMDWDQMWRVVTEGRLRIKQKYLYSDECHHAIPVCVVMIREDVWQAMLALKNPWRHYEYDEKENYREVEVTFDYHKTKLTEAIKSILNEPVTGLDVRCAKKDSDFEPFRYYSVFQRLLLDNNNPAGALGLEFYVKKLVETIEGGEHTLESPEIQDMIQRIAEVLHVKIMYSVLRRTWHPGTGQGSQSVEFLTQAHFHHAMAMLGYRAAEHELKRRIDWGLDDEDESQNTESSKTINRLDEVQFLTSLNLPNPTD